MSVSLKNAPYVINTWSHFYLECSSVNSACSSQMASAYTFVHEGFSPETERSAVSVRNNILRVKANVPESKNTCSYIILQI